MKILLVTDAWMPQVNGVVTTLVELADGLRERGHTVEVIHPGLFRTWPCPGYAGISLALFPGRALRQRLGDAAPDVVHIATEGPLGWAARRECRRRGWAFTTAFHTKFPEILHAALRVPLGCTYTLFRHFHRASSGVMVPTQGVLEMLEQRGFQRLRPWTHGVDTRLFAYAARPAPCAPLGALPRPLSLYVGRVSYGKGIADFLAVDIPGSKGVCGVGPLEASLRARFPQVVWLGLLPRHELAGVYAAADVFVFPSRSETFGLVLLEAMACGVPVAAYPVDGPLQVLGDSGAGAMDPDLAVAWRQALRVSRGAARARAQAFGWARATELFLQHLVLVHTGTSAGLGLDLAQAVVELSHKSHMQVE